MYTSNLLKIGLPSLVIGKKNLCQIYDQLHFPRSQAIFGFSVFSAENV